MRDIKTDAFEYVLFKLNDWFKNAYPTSTDNDISTLKALKLLFFISAVDTYKDAPNTLLDDVFTNFVAMPYGHVESDVYTLIKQKSLVGVNIDNYKTTITSFNPDDIDSNLKDRIDISIDKLKSANYNLIKYTSFQLVDLSHMWYSWQYFYSKALKLDAQSFPIESSFIKSEEKIYSL